MNHRLFQILLATCVTSLGIATATLSAGPYVNRTLDPVATAPAASDHDPVAAAWSRTRFDVSPFPAPRIDPSSTEPEPVPTF